MRRRPQFGAAALIALTVLALAATPRAQPADAHPAAPHFQYGKWPAGSRVPWRFTRSVPTNSALRLSIRGGSHVWNKLDQSMRFRWVDGDVANFDPYTCAPPGRSAIHWRAMDGLYGVAGEAGPCSTYDFESGRWVHISFQMTLDSGERWYTVVSASGPAPRSDQLDLMGTAAHEFGHATGFGGHFDYYDAVCANTVNQQTMCPSGLAGTLWARTLGKHDLEVFKAAY